MSLELSYYSAAPQPSLIEELKIKEFTTASNVLFQFLNDRCLNLNVPLLNFQPIIPQTAAVFTHPQPSVPSPIESPLTPPSPTGSTSTFASRSPTVHSPISSPSTSVDSGVESEDDRRPHQCPECLKRFRFKSNLFEHKTLHQHSTPFVCPFCSKTCRLKGNLKKHLQVHVSNSEALEELWKSRFSRSSGRPRKQPLPPNNNNNAQLPPTPQKPQDISLPAPMATYPSAFSFTQSSTSPVDLNSLIHEIPSAFSRL